MTALGMALACLRREREHLANGEIVVKTYGGDVAAHQDRVHQQDEAIAILETELEETPDG